MYWESSSRSRTMTTFEIILVPAIALAVAVGGSLYFKLTEGRVQRELIEERRNRDRR